MCHQTVLWLQRIACVAGFGLLVGCSNPSAPASTSAEPPSPVAPKAPGDSTKAGGSPAGPVSAVTALGPRKVVSAFLTRSGGVPYRASRVFEAQQVAFSKVPGSDDVAARLALTGQPLPGKVFCLDRLSEASMDNLGLMVHVKNSYRAYIDPVYGQTVAFDMASTSGGVPQRMVGHRTKNGCHVVLYRGGRREEEKDIDFGPGIEILPVEMDFVHMYFLRNKDAKEMVRTFFVPEIAGFAELTATREGTEMVAVGGRNFECAKYLLRTGSSKAREGVTSRQFLWYDQQKAVLIKRLDLQGHEGSETVTERVEPERLETLTAMVVRSPKTAVDRPFPYSLDQELVYRVRVEDRRLGEIRITFSKQAADDKGPEGWRARALVNLTMKSDQGVNLRQEEAVTRFDALFCPVDYLAVGKESAGARAEYTIHTHFGNGKVALRVRRETGPLASDTAALPGEVEPARGAADWDEPLPRIVLSGDDQEDVDTRRRVQNERFERPLSDGVFAFDYHRVEHLAVALYRMPFPERSKAAGGTDPVLSRAVAFYAVRQNISSLVGFWVSVEPRAEGDDPKTPDLYSITTGNLLLAGQILMDSKGRLLQWTTRCGTQEIVYTLDDPIMQERERRLDRTRVQEGPLLIRPPWY